MYAARRGNETVLYNRDCKDESCVWIPGLRVEVVCFTVGSTFFPPFSIIMTAPLTVIIDIMPIDTSAKVEAYNRIIKFLFDLYQEKNLNAF